MLIIGGIPQEAVESGGDLTTVITNLTPLVTAGGGGYIRQDSTATLAKESGGNLATIKTNSDPLVTAGGGGYVRQDSTATIAKESGGNLATVKTNTDPLVTAGGGGYVRQDSTATIAKESGGNLADVKTAVTRAVKVPAVLTKANVTPGTALPIAAGDGTNAIEVLLTAKKVGGQNTGAVYFGTSAVHKTTSQQSILYPDDVIHLVAPVGSFYDLNDFYVDADNAADGVTGWYVPA